jgi:AcrR family transcriptional regulator
MIEEMSRIERKKLAARTRILEAAEALFLREDGYDKTTVRDIAMQADVSTGAVYMHFPSKPDIMAAMLDRIALDYAKTFTSISSKKRNGLKKIEKYINHFFNLVQQPKFLAYIHYAERLKLKEICSTAAASIRKRGMDFYVLMRDAIEEGQKDGNIQKLDTPDIMAFVFLHVTRSFVREITMEKSLNESLHHFPNLSREKVLDLLKKMLIASIEKKNC